VSPELSLLVAPRATYASLVRAGTPLPALAALRRPLLVAVVIGISLAISATHQVTPALVVSTTIAWSYVVLLQMAIAIVFLAPAARRTVGLARAIDLFFAGHAPWSLFALFVAAWAPWSLGHSIWPVAAAALAALVMTSRIVAAFFGDVLALDRRAARRMTIAHQAVTWSVFVAINWFASGVTARLLEVLRQP
jgi:hypothetical protein